MKKRIFFCLLSVFLLIPRVSAKEDYIRWVEFDVGLSPMQRALELDIASQGEEPPLSWIDLLALAATRCGGATNDRTEKMSALAAAISRESSI